MDTNTDEFKWRAPEFTRHERSVNWFLLLWSIVIFVSLIFLALGNITGIILALIAGISIHISAVRHPHILEIHINKEGVSIDGALIAFSEIRQFSLFETKDHLDEVIFDTHKLLPSRMRIILDPRIRMEELRAFLAQFLKEVEHEEGFVESLSKLLKI